MDSGNEDEVRLIIRAQKGDTAAYEVLVRRYQDLAFRTAWVILRHQQDAQDATQTAFLKSWRALPTFLVGAPFRPWLLRIVVNEAKNRRDHRWRWPQTHVFTSEAMIANTDMLPEDLIARSETSRELVAAIERLKPSDQQILLLRYALDLSEREIAATLDIKPGTVKSRLHRATARLREVVDANE